MKRAFRIASLASALAVASVLLTLRFRIWTPPLPPKNAPARPATAEPTLPVLIRQLRDAPGRTDSARRLAVFRANLGTKSETESKIRRLLATGQDGRTQLGFKLNRDGSLAEAPTVRTFLLDQLALIAPQSAAEIAREILQNKTSPDEWAVSLRALALGNDSGGTRRFLQLKAREMIEFPSWQQDPSVGFLEAFDLFVYTRDTGFVPELCRLAANPENRAVAHAAFLALDRLVLADPGGTLETILEKPELLAGRESTRAGFFARADVSDPVQEGLLKRYLASVSESPGELEKFAALFPNANFMISNNLLTRSGGFTAQELRRRDEAALKATQEWLADAAFTKVGPQLSRIRERLQQFRELKQPSP